MDKGFLAQAISDEAIEINPKILEEQPGNKSSDQRDALISPLEGLASEYKGNQR